MFVYRGYMGYANFDGKTWYGCVLDIPDLIEYRADTHQGLELAFRAKVDDIHLSEE